MRPLVSWLPSRRSFAASQAARSGILLFTDKILARCGKGNFWRDGLPLKHRSTIFPVDYSNFAGERADILVTHEAPSSHRHGFAAIDELARRLSVTSSFHGHHHDRLDYSGERTRLGFDAFGVGLRGITDQDGRVILVGEIDEARSYRNLARPS